MATSGWKDVTRADVAKMGRRDPRLGNPDPFGKTARSKYGAKKTVVDNITFDSAKEANRYGILKMMLNAGKIRDLECQPVFSLDIGTSDDTSVHVGEYRGDFRYYDHTRGCIIEDVKSKATATPLYKLKKRLVEALYGVEIVEV